MPAMWDTQAQSLGRKDSLEKEKASLSSILPWRISWTEVPGGVQSMESQRVGHDWVTNIFLTLRSNVVVNIIHIFLCGSEFQHGEGGIYHNRSYTPWVKCLTFISQRIYRCIDYLIKGNVLTFLSNLA